MAINKTGQQIDDILDSAFDVVLGGFNIIRSMYNSDNIVHAVQNPDSANNNISLTEVGQILPGRTYIFSVDSTVVTSGSATTFDVILYNYDTESVLVTEKCLISTDRQSLQITVPSNININHNIRIIKYAGTRGNTLGISMTHTNMMLEDGNVLTSYAPNYKRTIANYNTTKAKYDTFATSVTNLENASK